MAKTATLDVTATSDKEYEAIVDQHLAQLRLMQQKMDEEQREIETLRAETDAILADIFQTLMPANTIRRSIVDVLADAPGHLAFQDAASVDAYVRNERASWNNE